MKHKLKNYLKLGILLFGISFLITNCEKVENNEEFNLNENKSYKVISLNEITKHKPKVADIIDNLKTKNSSEIIMYRGGETYLGIDHVLTDKVIQITDSNNVSTFTFGIDTDFENTGYIENLHLIEVDNNYIGYIMRYEPSTDWILDPNNYTPKGDLVLNLLTFNGNITKYSLKGELIWTTEPTELERVWVETCAFTVVEYCSNTYADNPDGTAHVRGPKCKDGPFTNQTELVCTMVFLGGGPVIGNGPGGTGNPDDDGGNFHDSVGGSGDGYDNNCEQVTGTLINDALPLDGIASGCTTNTDTGVSQVVIINPKNHCEKLNKLTQADSLNVSIKPYIDTLRTKTELDKEYYINFRKNSNYGEIYNVPIENNVTEGPSLRSSKVKIGTFAFGHIHTHPKGTYPMFSWNDLKQLNDIYTDLYESFKEDAFLTMVADNGSVYSLKVDDIEALSAIIEQDLENAKGNTEKEKTTTLNKKIQINYSLDAENTERVFLKEFGNYGISIYKATDENLSNWAKLELDANDNENVTETPCN